MAKETTAPPAGKQPSIWIAALDVSIGILGYVFMILLGGLIGALFVGFLDHELRQWGWLAIALFVAVGIPLGIVRPDATRSESRCRLSSIPWEPLSIFLGGKTMYFVGGPVPTTAGTPEPRRAGIVESCFILTVFGCVIGLSLGFAIVLVLASLALSPFTPDSWRENLQIGFLGLSTNSVVPWAIFGFSAACCTTLGLLTGIVLRLCGRIWSVRYP